MTLYGNLGNCLCHFINITESNVSGRYVVGRNKIPLCKSGTGRLFNPKIPLRSIAGFLIDISYFSIIKQETKKNYDGFTG